MAEVVTRNRVGEILQAVLHELNAVGGEARLGELLKAVEPKFKFTDHEKALLEKSGLIRWQSLVQFYSIDLVKAGAIKKEANKWYLTDYGKELLKVSPVEMMRQLGERYRAWKRSRDAQKAPSPAEPEEEDQEQIERQASYEKAVEQARTGIEEHIDSLDPYDFQQLVAELLIAMGYHVPFVAPEGPDGGVDVIAYRDPLGTQTPRIRVQVKHRNQKVTVNEVRELEGVLRREGDIGLIVSSGGFTGEAEREIRSSNKHIEVMDLNRLIKLWQENYEKVRESGKKLLPLVRLYFLAPTEES
jgi:restriction system protein